MDVVGTLRVPSAWPTCSASWRLRSLAQLPPTCRASWPHFTVSQRAPSDSPSQAAESGEPESLTAQFGSPSRSHGNEVTDDGTQRVPATRFRLSAAEAESILTRRHCPAKPR